MMDLLNDISNQIQQSKINWSSISSSIGIDGNDILNIQKECNPTVEFVHSVTKKIWKDIFDYVGLSLTTNDCYSEVSSILKLGKILAGRCFEENGEKIDNKIVEEISQKVSQWKTFGRILALNESYLNQVERDFQSCYERNHEIMKKFTSPLEPDESWSLWRSYLQQFEDGINVIKEMEATHVEFLVETPAEISHIIRKGDQLYIGHSYGYEDNKSIQINKQDSIIGVQVGSKDFNCIDYQEFNEWVTTQQRYIDIYDMLKDQKSINFAEGNETFCPILDTMKQYLEITNDPGFVVKGYNYVKHYSLFKKGILSKDNLLDIYFCYIANANVVLYITRSTNGAGHALYQSLRNIQIANILHEDLQMNNVVQINVIIHEDNETSDTNFCKQCIENELYISKDIFTDIERFTSWYDELVENFKIQNENKMQQESSSSPSKNVNELCKKLKKDILTYEALENNNIFPSFSTLHEDEMEELKKLVVLSPTQFKVLHSKEKHILLRGSYGCGKSVVLLKKLEQVISKKGESDIIYLICHDQQSELIHYMKFIQSKFPGQNILVCNSHDILPKRELPELSLILQHILRVWENRIIHIFMDEFNGSYIDEDEVIRLSELLNSFENSFIVIALQSMEEFFFKNQKGYQYDLLSDNTSFVCHNLDYSLRCSYEINEFVKSTADLLESVKVDVFEKSYIALDKFIVDKEHGREREYKVSKSPIKSFYRYNQPEIIGHHVSSGPVNVYYVEGDTLLAKQRPLCFLPVLKFILKNVSDIKHYVICTYDEELYNTAYEFLKINFSSWTNSINEFLKQDKPFNILLTEYAGVRGYEFQNFVFLLPLGQKFLKFRMIECFARATTELHVIADNTNRNAKAIDKQLIKRWKKMEVVKYFDCKYYRRTDTIDLVHGETKIFSEAYPSIHWEGNPTMKHLMSRYRWKIPPSEISNVKYLRSYDLQGAALLCIMNADDTKLFNEFCTTHNIDILSYVYQHDGNDMLKMAVEANAIKIICLLIESYNFDINSKNRSTDSVLHIASRNGNIDIFRILIENGADVTAEYSNYISDSSYNFHKGFVKPIHEAVMHGHADIIDFLIKNKADVLEKTNKGHSLLHFGAYNGQVNVIQRLLDLGLDIQEQSNDGRTPLHTAAVYGHVNVVRFLIENGADIYAKDNNGFTCIDVASEFGYHDIVKIMKSLKEKTKS